MSINTIPECFANNFHLRDGFSYKDLSLYLLTSEEKEFLVQQILHLEKHPNNNGLLIDPFECDWLNCGATRLVSNRYNINYDTVKGWRSKYKRNKHLNTYSERPADIDKISHAVILKAIKDAEIPTVEGIRPLVKAKINELFLQEKMKQRSGLL